LKVALYLHFPFCLQKCRYCSFNSLPICQIVSCEERRKLIERYLNAEDNMKMVDDFLDEAGEIH
jgi:coproporphyrinogen III oxidase-like Fe-S oxidoreductase